MLGSEDGLPIRMLTPAAQMMVRNALRSGLKVVTMDPARRSADFYVVPGGSEVTSLNEPIDIGQVRIRMRLRSAGVAGIPVAAYSRVPGGGAGVPAGSTAPYRRIRSTGEMQNYPSARLEFFVAPEGDSSWTSGAGAARVVKVRNTYKPSDLLGERYTQPFGQKGTFRIADVARRVSAITGLTLIPGREREDWPVFIGSADVTCGELLDGLRLALCAAWRRVGTVYALAWDRRGLVAVETLSREASLPAEGAVTAAFPGLPPETRMALGLALPFEPDDPYAWTSQQRDAYFGEPQEAAWDKRIRRFIPVAPFTYSAMSGSQQAAVDSAIAGDDSLPADIESEKGKAALTPSARFECSIYLPGTGWVYTPSSRMADLSSDSYRFRYEVARNDVEARRAQEQIRLNPPKVRPVYHAVIPNLVVAHQRALVIAPQPVDELVRTLRSMKAAGFTTLFYPALTGGYAAFRTSAFPTMPALGNVADLTTATRLARAVGLSTVAVVQTLAWRPAGAKTHWMDSHPDLLDVDPLKRPLTVVVRRFAESNPTIKADAVGDTVQPNAPEVRRRLNVLMTDLARVNGLAGVSFETWYPSESVLTAIDVFHLSIGLALGYSDADRLPALLRDGQDPLDGCTGSLYSTEPGACPPLPAAQEAALSAQSMAGPARFIEPMERLLAVLKKANPTLTRYCRFVSSQGGNGSDLAPREAIPIRFSCVAEVPSNVWVPVVADDVLKDRALAGRSRSGSILVDAEQEAMVFAGRKGHVLVVYDMRYAPRHVMQALEEVTPRNRETHE